MRHKIRLESCCFNNLGNCHSTQNFEVFGSCHPKNFLESKVLGRVFVRLEPCLGLLFSFDDDISLMLLLPGKRDNKPNYTHVFNSETLQRIAVQLPLTVSELAAVEGVAAVKAERYGTEFLEITMKFTCKLSGNQPSVELAVHSVASRELC